MTKYFRLRVHSQCRAHTRDGWQGTGGYDEKYGSLKEALSVMRDRYEGRGVKMYQDTGEESMEVGRVFTYWDCDWGRSSKKFQRQDWVSITTINEIPVDFKGLKHSDGVKV